LEKETKHFLFTVLDFALSCFENKNHLSREMGLSEKFKEQNISDKYQHIKYLHGEIHNYGITLQKEHGQPDEPDKLERFMSAIRNGMYAAKNFKDALADIEQLKNSANDIKFGFYSDTKKEIKEFIERMGRLILKNNHIAKDELIPIYKSVTDGYTGTLHKLYQQGIAGHVNETEISTLLNFNREIYTAFKSLFFGLKEFLLDKDQSRQFDELPGFIR